MDSPYEAVKRTLGQDMVEAAGINIFRFPGTRDDFADRLINTGAQQCIIKYGLRFEDRLIDLDVLFQVVDIITTIDGCVIFYNPDSRILDLKVVRRPPA
ncbi:hypothetical protein CUJ83_11810 [Methanocella sp. CWC-04]|uniref:Uncharacterized protein n=1 Tax=Methanooceanicella nereidis TaxID=2052831 RepID=A0AAP2RE53_9EURY|nr:hypothetical protein [Methanocella sp. CWC-04]MCD1295683.1 hypothetical protein [Methanocella sp. CWC-04]